MGLREWAPAYRCAHAGYDADARRAVWQL